MNNVTAGLIVVIALLGGWYLLLLGVAGMFAYLLIGVGLGIGCGVAGSLAHDALAGTSGRP